MYILSLHEDSNANATLFADGKVLFSVAEERLTRRKYQAGFPTRSIQLILNKYNLSLADIDIFVCANKYHPLSRILWDKFPTFEHFFLGLSQKLTVYYQHALNYSCALRNTVEKFNAFMLKKKFGKKVILIDHHTAHAYSAYITSGFDKTLTITTDNFGDGLSSAVFTCENGHCRLLYSSSALNSPGQFYGEIAQTLGFHPLLAGKMTGLAAFGNPEPAYTIMKDLFTLDHTGKNFVLPPLINKFSNLGAYKKLLSFPKKDVAAAAQKRFEEIMLLYIKEALKQTGMERIALAGGVFGNVRLNQKIASLPQVKEIFIHPGMSDQGISLGAGFAYLAENLNIKPFKLESVYWGPDYTICEIETALKESNLRYEIHKNIEETVAQLLCEGKTIAYFSGRLEYGPRALGNRSILYQTTDKTVNDWLNKKLKRSEFMPFAPVTLEEYGHECYIDIEKVKYNTKFMTISVDCTEWMKKTSPAVVHIDGTARPQIIKEKDNPAYYRILREYHKLTGIPSLINTSFNMHEEPIVNSPPDAIRAFKAAGLDYLVMENYLVKP